MPRPKKTAPSSPTSSPIITVADAAASLKTTEQALRLALIDIRPDDFDTLKSLSLADYDAVAEKIIQQQQQQHQPQLPAQAQNLESAETATQQDLQPATKQPQKSPIVAQAQQHHVANAQSPMPNTGLSLVEMVAKQSQEEIAAVDGVLQVRNALVCNAMAVRDAELTEHINQHWQSRKGEYLGAIHELASLAQTPVQITPDNSDITAEIDKILGKLKTC